jgi:hypothetical protein
MTVLELSYLTLESNNMNTNTLQEMFNTCVSIYEAALASGVDGLTLHRMDTMMEWAVELAESSEIDTGELDRVSEYIVYSEGHDVAILDADYDDTAEWADVDASFEAADGDDEDGDDSDDCENCDALCEPCDNVIQLNAP